MKRPTSMVSGIVQTAFVSFCLICLLACHPPAAENPLPKKQAIEKQDAEKHHAAPIAEAATQAQEKPAGVLPKEASDVIDRLAACTHFSGEFNGDHSERDKEVAATMTELQCDSIEQEADALRKQYSDNAAVLHALDSAVEL